MLLTTIIVAPLLWAAPILATITLEPVPSELRAGSEYNIKWSQDRDYVSCNAIINPPFFIHFTQS